VSPFLATLVFIIAIAGLFWLDRDRKARTSPVLWIPVAWFLINGSRPVSQWLQMGPTIETPDQYLDGSPVDAFVFGILLVTGLVILARARPETAMILRNNWPIVLFFLYCGLSTVWSDYTFVSFKRWIKALGDVVMGLVVLTDPEPLPALKRFFSRTGFLLIPLSVLFIKYYPQLGRAYNPWTWEPTYVGVTLFKNELGMICLIAALASVWRLTTAVISERGKVRTRHLVAHGTLIVGAIWLFWMANSMTSLSCFLMASALIVWTYGIFRGRARLTVHALVLAIVGASFSVLFLNMGGDALQTMGRDPTLTGRTTVWKIVLSVADNPLVGTGFESFWLGDRLERIWNGFKGLHLQEAHNGYLEVYLNLGWMGVTLLAVVIVIGYQNVQRMLRRNAEAGSLRLALFVCGVVYSLTEAGFRMLTPIWTVFLLVAMYVPEKHTKTRKTREPDARRLTIHFEAGSSKSEGVQVL
jgi:exopolysaccharide production protein ExoQ